MNEPMTNQNPLESARCPKARADVSGMVFDKRHPDDHYIDEIRIFVRERYKTSGLSGDEWRFHSVLAAYRKGVCLFERPFNGSPQTVASFAPWIITAAMEGTSDDKVHRPDDKAMCFQPGCKERAISEYEIIEEFGPQGQKLHADEQHFKQRRRFCQKHLRRGDCGREDCDENYRVISGPGPGGADMRHADIRESRQMTVHVESSEQLGDAVATALRNRRM